MELRDLIVTPLVIIVVYVFAYFIRARITDSNTRRYFFPALTVRIVGALTVGLIYQFYYDGGDTFNFHTHGSRHLWEAFWDSPGKAIALFFNDGSSMRGVYEYASKIPFFRDPDSYAIVRIAFIFDLITFSSYSATAVLFSVCGFAGSWLFFVTFYKQYPHLHRPLAIASLFIPSVCFWGSGLLKDTITLAGTGMAVYATNELFIKRTMRLKNAALFLLSIYLLYAVKLYILLVMLPTIIIWVFAHDFRRITSTMVRLVLLPFVVAFAGTLGYVSVIKAGEDNPKYAISNLSKTAQITAYDIRYWTGRSAGSGYTLGELDGSFESMLSLAPQAINASLFRPYIWEANNPLMFFSALESLTFMVVFVYLVAAFNIRIVRAMLQPDILFLMVFAITFSFAVGVSTFNFGTLVRYKIPMMPFFGVALVLIHAYSKRLKNNGVLERTE